MSIPVIAFFNNKGGVGKTSMVYHLAWMFSDRGLRVIAADLDPQSNLTAAFLDEDRLEQVVSNTSGLQTIFDSLQPLLRGEDDIEEPHVEVISERLGLIVGDFNLYRFEDHLSKSWSMCLTGDKRALASAYALRRMIERAVSSRGTDVVLVDLGPNLGAINREAIIASDYIVIPLWPDLFALKNLASLGAALHQWKAEWNEVLQNKPASDLMHPSGSWVPAGYVAQTRRLRLDRPVKAFEHWTSLIPGAYAAAILHQTIDPCVTIDNDPHCLARLKDYRSLMPLAQEARKPMFFLKAADGALGAHAHAVSDAYDDFKKLAIKIAARTGLTLPSRRIDP